MEKIERGRKAERLLADPLLVDTLDTLERTYVDAWRVARTLDARENAHRFVTLIDAFRKDLASQALTGTLKARRRAELEGRTGLWRST